jgi:hypothetical protein
MIIVKRQGDCPRANSFRFFSVKVSLKIASLEEKNHREVEKVEVRKRKRDFVRELLRLFRLRG